VLDLFGLVSRILLTTDINLKNPMMGLKSKAVNVEKNNTTPPSTSDEAIIFLLQG